MKNTKGPWYVNGKRTGAFSGELHVMAGENYGAFSICLMQGGQNMERNEQEANARIIAAAPELLDSLKSMVGRFGGDGICGLDFECINNARAIIIKAEGKS